MCTLSLTTTEETQSPANWWVVFFLLYYRLNKLGRHMKGGNKSIKFHLNRAVFLIIGNFPIPKVKSSTENLI